MNTVQRIHFLFAIGTTLFCQPLLAQSTNSASPANSGGTKATAHKAPAIATRPLVLPSNAQATLPPRPDTAVLPKSISDAVKEFQAGRENYLKNAQAIARTGQESLAEAKPCGNK